MQIPNSSSVRLNVESVSVDPLVPVRVPAPLGVHKALASLSFCSLAGRVGQRKSSRECMGSRGRGRSQAES